MAVEVDVSPRLVQWAIARSGKDPDSIAERYPEIATADKTVRVRLRRLEAFAGATHVPLAILLLQSPPLEPLPVTDLRRMPEPRPPSANMLDSIYLAQQRQDWYREYAADEGLGPVPWVGSAKLADRTKEVGAAIRTLLGWSVQVRRQYSVSAAVTHVANRLDAEGVLVTITGVVGSNTSRPLDPQEFRGFTLADPLAPLIFVNGVDSKNAQLFTLAHECAHLALGESAVSSAAPGDPDDHGVEAWCNAVAAEVLVPAEDLALRFRPQADLQTEARRLGVLYRASSLVVIRRLHDAGRLDWPTYRAAYGREVAWLASLPRSSGSGGNFYTNLSLRNGRRFIEAVVRSTSGGATHYRDAFRMLGVSSPDVFEQVSARWGGA